VVVVAEVTAVMAAVGEKTGKATPAEKKNWETEQLGAPR
jgi:hypothetical protein